AGCDKICRYVDMPLQHINDAMLTAMKRETSGQYIRDLVARIRAGVPGIVLRTTFIVGFPGETKAQFEELLEFIAAAKFERLGVFAYSQEDHTAAGNLEHQLSAKLKATRRGKAMALQQKISRQVQRTFVGKTLRVLVEKQLETGWVGRAYADAPEIDGTITGTEIARIGEFAEVKITSSAPYDLKGELIRHG
ncbi:MAG: radical SAM protein, partial [Verrucomicrobiota bacterium]